MSASAFPFLLFAHVPFSFDCFVFLFIRRVLCLYLVSLSNARKVLSAEGNKGVPLDPALGDLLQGLLKLDSRHRLSARDALASPYFAPRPGAAEERVREHLQENATIRCPFFAASISRVGHCHVDVRGRYKLGPSHGNTVCCFFRVA